MKSSPLPAFFAGLMFAAAVQAQQPCVDLPNNAKICGSAESRDGYAANEYLGIRYATAGRFANPVLQTPAGTTMATQPGSICPQLSGFAVVGAEDCLFLNVWSPSNATPSSNLPVLVFIHGGAFVQGSSTGGQNGLLFDGIEMSNLGNPVPGVLRGMVVVTLNYRLGTLGFLAYKDGAGGQIAGNFGFLDQLAALQWVQKNIASFGGNPSQVTLAGQSAGAISVGYHAYSSTRSAGYFQQAILESNPMALPLPAASNGTTAVSAAVAKNLSCTTAACLTAADYRSLTLYGMLAYEQMVLSYGTGTGPATNLLPWGPILDGSLLVRQPLAGARSQLFQGPMIFGTNEQEGGFFEYTVEELLATLGSPTIGPAYYNNFLTSLFGQVPTGLPGKYVCGGSDCGAVFADLLTDYVFTCSNHALGTFASATSTFGYQFQHVPSFPFPACGPLTPCICQTEVCHSAELPFVWDSATAAGGAFTPQEAVLSDRMARLWASLVANGNPNRPNGLWNTIWPIFGGEDYLILDTGNFPISNTVAIEANCAYWDQLGYEGGILPGARH